MDPKKLRGDIYKYIADYKGKLRRKLVLLTKPKPMDSATKPDSSAWTDAELQQEADAPTPLPRYNFDPTNRGVGGDDRSDARTEGARVEAGPHGANRTLGAGEKQGIYGSEQYIRQHFGNPETMELKPEHAKLDVYFNHDDGTGKIRGIYLQ